MFRSRVLWLALSCVSFQIALAQSTPYALPRHNGAVLLNLDGFKVTQKSAKPDGREIGIRAHDAAHTEMLAFLFLTPEYKSQTPATCLSQDLLQIRKDNGKFSEQLNPGGDDNAGAATILLTYPSGKQVLYKYAGLGDQCLVIEVYADKGSKLDVPQASDFLRRQRYDAGYVPTADDVTVYATIEGVSRLATQKPLAQVPAMLVTWYGPGGIPLPIGPDWKLDLITAFDNSARPVAQFHNDSTHVVASFIIVENKSGHPTSESCRKDVMDGILKGDSGPLISNQTEGETGDGRGGKFATASHLTRIAPGQQNHDIFAFSGNEKTCAEIHVSTVAGKPDEDKRLAEALASFHPDLSYRPTSSDYFKLASALYSHGPILAAPFYDASLKSLSVDAKDADSLATRRVATDNIVIALGMSGNLKGSRAYAERGVKLDPDYPINYYNLACGDAEQGKADDAKLHLQQAFDRKANTLPGEKMPDPTQDDSIQKLKKNKEFWTFVQTLR